MRKALVLTMAAALVALMGSTAQATIRDITDPAGDVVTAIADDDGNDTYTREGGAEGDVVFARIQHTATQVVIYLRHRQLSVPVQYAGFRFEIQGNKFDEGERLDVEAAIHARHGDPQGYSYALNQDGRDCAHSSHINYAGDSAWMRIARACLKNLKYVRVNAITYQLRIPRAGREKGYYDNPVLDGGTIGEQSQVWTPWVVTD